MILPFSTQLNGEPNYFIEKIWKGLLQENFNLLAYNRYRTEASVNRVIDNWDYKAQIHPKIHTIREDSKNRWKRGKDIHFYINNRSKNSFCFAPVIPVVSTQRVFMTYAYADIIEITVSGKYLNSKEEKEQFAINDGFDNWTDFFNYFYPIIMQSPDEAFSGKIIHWTNFKY